jgi:hypothetical protein
MEVECKVKTCGILMDCKSRRSSEIIDEFLDQYLVKPLNFLEAYAALTGTVFKIGR